MKKINENLTPEEIFVLKDKGTERPFTGRFDSFFEDGTYKCKNCNGRKVVKEKKVLECVIDKGSPHGEKYVFHGESDEHPDKEPGDVIIVVNE